MGELSLECHNITMCSISYATATSIVKACSTYISDRLLTGQSHLSATTTYQATESVASDALSDSWWALDLFVCGASSGARGGENEESHHPRHFLGSISHTTIPCQCLPAENQAHHPKHYQVIYRSDVSKA
ncbi:uncharacterized protein AKAW2_10512A [Aspergillus luchuensis]|uniref:Uncharacterized protein n=1 Tax=Aspergillus kawachii TaxID=1069201 RepID=A0A7R7VZ95_ASPKA|nr:uncharacterized protein AKAW2_10512A [Aspergillus luchuensis]BCR93466.1 hypothetical protein AKAW2_10512A [Aspergillus luchuensis]